MGIAFTNATSAETLIMAYGINASNFTAFYGPFAKLKKCAISNLCVLFALLLLFSFWDTQNGAPINQQYNDK